jgi:hypothetical protein
LKRSKPAPLREHGRLTPPPSQGLNIALPITPHPVSIADARETNQAPEIPGHPHHLNVIAMTGRRPSIRMRSLSGNHRFSIPTR